MVLISTLPHAIIQSMMSKGIWTPECPVSLDDLRLMVTDYYDFNGHIKTGQMVIHHKITDAANSIFSELYKIKFPIHKMTLIDEYNGNDDLSMTDNNSSCFNYRKIYGTDRVSVHSWGTAIDINPRENPYITQDGKIHPEDGKLFLDRSDLRPGMVEPIVHLFTDHGFDWGGNWTTIKDYHHFEIKL